jgi:hypothetical protein
MFDDDLCFHSPALFVFVYIHVSTTDRKVPTTKDLEKPWAALAPPRRTTSPPAALPTAQPQPEGKRDESPPRQGAWSGHSAATTILLDDSHAKAALQPYNHICVPEYTRAQRNADLATLQQQARIAARQAQQQHAKNARDTNGDDRDRDRDQDQDHLPRKRRRIEEPQQQPRMSSADVEKKEKEKEKEKEEMSLDETLLAVIGILHAARLQSSIAGWLHDGALLSESRGGDGDGVVWFENTDLVREWARSGREAMRELGLEVQHGVEP